MTDPRITKTREKLYHTFGLLLQTKSFESISVSELVNAAGITRKTFYNHYQDKIDLVQEYQAGLTSEIQGIQSRHHQFDQSYFVEVFSLLDRQDILLTSLLSHNGSIELQAIIKGTMFRYCKKLLSTTISNPEVLEYQSVATANAIFGIIQHWLTTGKKSTPQELAKTLAHLKLIPHTIR